MLISKIPKTHDYFIFSSEIDEYSVSLWATCPENESYYSGINWASKSVTNCIQWLSPIRVERQMIIILSGCCQGWVVFTTVRSKSPPYPWQGKLFAYSLNQISMIILVALCYRNYGSSKTGLAALPHKNIHEVLYDAFIMLTTWICLLTYS